MSTTDTWERSLKLQLLHVLSSLEKTGRLSDSRVDDTSSYRNRLLCCIGIVRNILERKSLRPQSLDLLQISTLFRIQSSYLVDEDLYPFCLPLSLSLSLNALLLCHARDSRDIIQRQLTQRQLRYHGQWRFVNRRSRARSRKRSSDVTRVRCQTHECVISCSRQHKAKILLIFQFWLFLNTWVQYEIEIVSILIETKTCVSTKLYQVWIITRGETLVKSFLPWSHDSLTSYWHETESKKIYLKKCVTAVHLKTL